MYLFASEASYQKFEAEPRRYLEALAQMQTSMARRPAGPYGPPAAPSTSQSWRGPGDYGGAPY